jgi:hypothetical protein
MERAGFVGDVPNRRFEAYLDYQSEIAMSRGTLTVELQWALVPRYFSMPVTFEPFWSRLRTLEIQGRAYRAPATSSGRGSSRRKRHFAFDG